MSGTRRGPGPTPVSAGIDAFRRPLPQPARPDVSQALDELTASVDPAVVLASLARLSVSIGFADGCELELTDGPRPTFRASTTNATADGVPSGADAPRTIATPLHCPSRGQFESFSGLLVHWWNGRDPDAGDRLLAEVLARYGVSVVDRQRLLHTIAEREERSSQLTMQAITGRWTNVAAGLVMGQLGVDVEDAEDVLRDAAGERGITVWDLALETVRARGLVDRAGPPVAGETVRRRGSIRSVPPVDDRRPAT